MDRLEMLQNERATSFPHTRGDGPDNNGPPSRLMRFSPHAWGWTARGAKGADRGVVFPTRVGMDRGRRASGGLSAGFPHTRGDGPQGCRTTANRSPFSPHAWGWTVKRSYHGRVCAVFPTRVGMDRLLATRGLGLVRFPHTRGDGPELRQGLAMLCEVFPTRVGMDRYHGRLGFVVYRFPHTRGDGPVDIEDAIEAGRFSPHAWGWTGGDWRAGRRPAVFPTRVGMDRYRMFRQCARQGFPHTRGDGPYPTVPASILARFSPHAWGWTGLPIGDGLCPLVFPTRVGMDRRRGSFLYG
jgi:hypothetical protein